MIPADVAQRFLPQFPVHLAQTVLPEKPAAFPLFQAEVGGIGMVNGLLQFLPHKAGDGFVPAERVRVNVDLPADAATVAALVGNAGEIVIIRRIGNNHRYTPCEVHGDSIPHFAPAGNIVFSRWPW
jgi:hypothetical protein